MKTKAIKIGKVIIGGSRPFVLLAGPCVLESETLAFACARELKKITSSLGIGFIFKSSYDKANRSSIDSYRGPGLNEGLRILRKIKEEFGVPVLSDVHCRSELAPAAEVLDIIQIPAFLSRQTDLIQAAAATGRVVNIKKGQFLAPWDMKHVLEKIKQAGGKDIIITERGTTFGYNNLVTDFRSLLAMRKFGYPVVYDATHSVQLPGGLGKSSGGESSYIPGLARAAVAMGCDGIFLEVHPNPRKALCDAPNAFPLKEVKRLLIQLQKIDRIMKQ